MKTDKAGRTAKRPKRDHRTGRREGGRPGRADGFVLTPLGGRMDRDGVDRIVEAMGRFHPTGGWPEIAPMIVPLLKRRSHPYPAEIAPFQMHVPPGVWAGFGIDLGPAFSHVTAALIEEWGIDEATLLGTALDNVRRLALDEPPHVDRIRPDGIETTVVQAQGWGSALILAPDRLRTILGAQPRILITPVRNTLLAMPDDVDASFAADLWQALAEGCHDELDVEPMRWTGSSVVMLGAGVTGRPN